MEFCNPSTTHWPDCPYELALLSVSVNVCLLVSLISIFSSELNKRKAIITYFFYVFFVCILIQCVCLLDNFQYACLIIEPKLYMSMYDLFKALTKKGYYILFIYFGKMRLVIIMYQWKIFEIF